MSGTDAGRASLGALFRLAIAAGVPKAVEIQIRRGAPVDGRDAAGRSPLMLAAFRGHLELCRLLLSLGADISLVDDKGCNAAQLAGSRGHVAAASLIEGWAGEQAADPPAVRENDPLPPEPESCAPVLSASAFGRSGSDEPCPIPGEADEMEVGEPRPVAMECDAAATPLGMHADVPAIPQADADQTAWSDEWEPEEDHVLSTSDLAIETAATAIHLHLATHRPIVDDADWSDVEVELPVFWHLWARGFREEFDAAHHLDRLLGIGLLESRIDTGTVVDFLSNTPSGSPDERLERHLVMALEALGILVEDEQPLEASRDLPDVRSGKTEHDRSVSRDVMDFLDDMAAESWSDLGLLETAMRKFPPPPSAAEEARLFHEHQAALDRIVVAACEHPAARAIIMEWPRRVAASELSVQDLFRQVDDERNGQGTAQAVMPEASSAAASLHRLVEATPAIPTASHNRILADGLLALGLTPVRVMEMAEAVLLQPLAARPATRWMLKARREAFPSGDDLATTGTSEVAIIRAVRQAVDHYFRRRDLIVAMNLRMVVWQGRRHIGAKLQLADILQEGALGLLRAIQRFDPDRDIRFATYAIWWIRQAMSRSFADTARTIRLPVHVQDKRSRLGKLENRLFRTLGRQPDPAELARALGEPVEIVRRLQRSEMEMIPLDQVLADEQEDLSDSIPVAMPAGLVDFEPSPLDRLLHADLRASLEYGLGQIDQRQRSILVLRFGLEDGIPRTLEEVGQIYGVTRERIRQIEAKALGRLKRLLPSKNFEAMQP